MIKIISPSYKRPDSVITSIWFPHVTYLVGKSEQKEYEDNGHSVITIPDSVNGNIARVRNYILDMFKNTPVLIIDDDIEAVKKWEYQDDEWTHKTLTGDEFLEFIELGFQMAAEWGVNLWGMNCLGDKGSYREYTPFSCKSYISASFHGIYPSHLRYDENIPLKEDYDFCIQHLNEFRSTLRFNMYSMVKKDHGNPGGCAVYRTIDREKEQLKLLQKKWGSSIVKNDLTEKKNQKKKSGFDLNPIIKVPIPGI